MSPFIFSYIFIFNSSISLFALLLTSNLFMFAFSRFLSHTLYLNSIFRFFRFTSLSLFLECFHGCQPGHLRWRVWNPSSQQTAGRPETRKCWIKCCLREDWLSQQWTLPSINRVHFSRPRQPGRNHLQWAHSFWREGKQRVLLLLWIRLSRLRS